ncbi:hypothetical protein EG328_007687 [Venturia inaequalis]|uniref:Uncharacterized protein n=1 Tax=Venturia inaequalis TaxID=5025 RepID=A0A8H3UEN5_VENIN|nr:hypothetical protein EG328_007687 [Venturia inaequalis]
MARSNNSARTAASAAAAAKDNTIVNTIATESIADVKAARMEAVIKYLKAYDRSMESVKLGLILLKAIPGVISSVNEYLILSRLLIEARVSRTRPEFIPDTVHRRRVELKETTVNKLRAAYQSARDRFLANMADNDPNSAHSAHPPPPPAMAPTANVNPPRPQESAKKIVKTTTPLESITLQPSTAITLKVVTPKVATPKVKTQEAQSVLEQTAPAGLTLKSTPLKPRAPSVDTSVVKTPNVAMPVDESPSPAAKIFAAESVKFKTRRTRNKKAKVPASPSPVEETKDQAAPTPPFPSSHFDFRATPSKQALVKVNATVPTLGSTHVRNVSDSSSTTSFIIAGRSRGDSSSSLDEDKPSTGKTTPHRLSEASDKPCDLFSEYAPEPIVEADSMSSDEPSFVTEEATTAFVTEIVTAGTPVEEKAASLSAEESLLSAVANDTSSAFFKRITSRPSSKKYEDLLPTPLSTFGKTTVMVNRMMNATDVAYTDEYDEAHNIELVNSLDVYHHSALPKMVLSTEQVLEQAAFDLAISKHRNDLMQHAAHEIAPKVPQTKADAQMSALFAIGIQSLEKNGTLFFNQQNKPSTPVANEIMDIEQDPAIVSMVASFPSVTGLAATLAHLGPNRPLASWRKSMPPMMMACAPVDGLEAAITRLRAREAAKFAVPQPIAPAPVIIERSIETISSMKDSQMDKYIDHGFSGMDLAEIEESITDAPISKETAIELPMVEEPTIEAPTIKEHALKAVLAPTAAVPTPILATTKAPTKTPKASKPSKTVAKLTGPRTHDAVSKKDKRAMKKAGLLQKLT